MKAVTVPDLSPSFSRLKHALLGRPGNEVLDGLIVQLVEAICLGDGRHVIEGEAKAVLFQVVGVEPDRGGEEQRHVVHANAVLDQRFAS